MHLKKSWKLAEIIFHSQLICKGLLEHTAFKLMGNCWKCIWCYLTFSFLIYLNCNPIISSGDWTLQLFATTVSARIDSNTQALYVANLHPENWNFILNVWIYFYPCKLNPIKKVKTVQQFATVITHKILKKVLQNFLN